MLNLGEKEAMEIGDGTVERVLASSITHSIITLVNLVTFKLIAAFVLQRATFSTPHI